MRKKLLSLLTVLCLVLGMLPTTALAAATEAYENNEVALIITTDTEITEDVDGLVLVDAPCTVTVTDAKLSVGIVVSPDAAGAEVVLNGATEAAEVVVLAAASVKVEETANAGIVTVDAAEATVEIAGTAAEITVTENAEKTTVTVAETAKVTGDVTNAAPESVVSIKGEVSGNMTTAETAVGATTEVAETATVSGSVTNAAPDSTMKVDGKVEGGIANTETATGATLEVGANAEITGEVTDATGELTVTGDGAANITVTDTSASDEDEEDSEDAEDEDDGEDADDATEEENTPAFDDVAPPPATYNGPRIVWAPLHDHKHAQGSHDENCGTDQTSTLATNPNVSTPVLTGTVANDAPRASVTVSADNITQHTNADGGEAKYWIGFGVEVPETKVGEYHYYVFEKTEGVYGNAQHMTSVTNRVYQMDETTFFNTFYVNVGPNGGSIDFTYVVTDGTNNSTSLEEMLASDNVVCVLDVTLDVDGTTPASTAPQQDDDQDGDSQDGDSQDGDQVDGQDDAQAA